MRAPARPRRRAPDRGCARQAEGGIRRSRLDGSPGSQDGILCGPDWRLPECLHRADASAATRPDYAIANYLDVAAKADPQESARSHRDLARDPKWRPRPRRAVLRRSRESGGGGRAQHDRAIIHNEGNRGQGPVAVPALIETFQEAV